MKNFLEFESIDNLSNHINKEGISFDGFSIEDVQFYLEDKSRKFYTYINVEEDEIIQIEIDNREQSFYVSHEFIY